MRKLTMQLTKRIRNGGWGTIFLFLFSLLTIHFLAPQTLYIKLIALVPPILVLFLAEHFSFELIDFFAGGNLRRSSKEIEAITGDDHFFEAADEQVQNRVDKFDDHAYEYTVAILSAIVIAVTAPILGYLVRDIIGLLGGLVLSASALQLLGRRSIRELNSLAEDIVEPYKANYENQ